MSDPAGRLLAPFSDQGEAPVVPDYREANLAALAPALLAEPDRRPDWLPAGLREAERVVLLVVDGLGWEQLRERARVVPQLSGLEGVPITSVAPTTTATALSSISLGCSPAEHGVLGYKLRVEGPTGPEVMNVLRWRTPSGDARHFVDPRSFQERPAFGGRPIPVVTMAAVEESGFSGAHQGGTRHYSWHYPSAIPVHVRRLVADGEPFVYAYYSGVDTTAHAQGLGEFYEAELIAVERLVSDMVSVLPHGTRLAVTADHGQVETQGGEIRLDENLLSSVDLVSGEPRFRWLHCGPERVSDVYESAVELYGDLAWVRTFEQIDNEGWFGPPVPAEWRSRLGDVAIVARAPVAYMDPTEKDRKLICRHGSLTPAEMYVPLLVAG